MTPTAPSTNIDAGLWLAATGLCSMLAQVVLLRELNVAFYGTELIYVLSLGAWMMWTALGAALGRPSERLPSGRIHALLLALALGVPLDVALVRGLRILAGGIPGAYLPFTHQVLTLALALLPIGLASGLLFRWSARRFVAQGGTLARAYAIESLGGVAGGILATLALMVGLQNWSAAMACGLMALLAAALPPRRGDRPWLAALGAVALMLLTGLVLGPDLDRGLTALNHPDLLATRDTPYGRVTIAGTQAQVAVFENDALVFESEGTSAEEFAGLAALTVARPERVLVLGGGQEGLVQALQAHQPIHIDDVELNPLLAGLLETYLGSHVQDKNVSTWVDDPRRFLAGADPYDIILVGMPEPDSGQANRFYTQDFFRQCAIRLTPRGVLALRLRGTESVWTSALARRTASIDRALRAVFADVVFLPGSTQVILASMTPLERDPEVLVARLEERGIQGRVLVPAWVRYQADPDRIAETAAILAGTPAPPNTDSRPVCYTLTMVLWLSRFFPSLAQVEIPAFSLASLFGDPTGLLVMVALTSAMALTRRRVSLRRFLLAGVAGFAGMVLENILILHYQTTRGVLFQDLGLLITLFMGGLTLGSAAADHLPRRSAMAVLLLAGLAGLGLVTGLLIQGGHMDRMWLFSVLLAATGFLVAALFVHASHVGRPDPGATVAPLYAADLVGGCVGSILASLLLIPLLGLPGSALLVSVLAVLTMLVA